MKFFSDHISFSGQVEGMKMVVSNSTNLANCRSSFLSAMGQAVLISKEQTSSHDNVAEMISDLKVNCSMLWFVDPLPNRGRVRATTPYQI